MSKKFWTGLVVACAMLAAGAAVAADEVIFKSGDLAFTILKSDGVTPVEGAEVKVKASARSKALAESVTDKQGNVVLNLASGQYVLNVLGRNISELKVADDGALSVCRVVLDDDKAGLLLTGGAAAAGAGAAVGAAAVGAGTLSTVVIGGVAVMVAAGGGYAVYDHNKDDDDDEDEEPVVPPTPVRPSTRTRPSNR